MCSELVCMCNSSGELADHVLLILFSIAREISSLFFSLFGLMLVMPPVGDRVIGLLERGHESSGIWNAAPLCFMSGLLTTTT